MQKRGPQRGPWALPCTAPKRIVASDVETVQNRFVAENEPCSEGACRADRKQKSHTYALWLISTAHQRGSRPPPNKDGEGSVSAVQRYRGTKGEWTRARRMRTVAAARGAAAMLPP